MVLRLPDAYRIDPDDPRAPPEEVWARMSPDERERVVAMLPGTAPLSEGEELLSILQIVLKEALASREEAERRAEAEAERAKVEAERAQAEAERAKAEAERAQAEAERTAQLEREVADLRAEIERLRQKRDPSG